MHPLLANALELLEEKALHTYLRYAEEHAAEEEERIAGEEAAALEGMEEDGGADGAFGH